MQKKAFVEIQLNWIYIIIIGAIILVFFVIIGTKYMKNAELKINAEILNQLDTTIIGAAQAGKSANVINIEDAALSFSCSCKQNDCNSKIEVGDSGIAKDTAAFPIFSVKTIQDSPLITWTLDWNTPFKATNLLYLTRDDVHYYIFSDADDSAKQFAQQLYEKLQDNKFLKVTLLDDTNQLSVMKADNLYLLRLLYITTTAQNNLQIPPTKKAANIDILQITPLQDNAGTISYKRIKRNGKEIVPSTTNPQPPAIYLDTPTLVAAIFSEDKDSYICNMNKAFKRYNHVKEILKVKAQQLAAAPQYAHCQYYYNELATALTPKTFEQITQPQSYVAEMKYIEDLNEQLLVAPGGRCPRVY